jgi:hypothetical protein
MSNYQLSVIQYPSGTWGFVGSVPIQLGFVTKAGNTVTAAEVESQMRLPASYRTIKDRVFQSEDEAWNEAARLGFVKKEVR